MDEPELVVLFADAEAERFVTRLIERGIERSCLREMKWRAVRDPMHDASVARAPTSALGPFLQLPLCRFLIILDHHGSGADAESREALESSVAHVVVRAGVESGRVVAIAFEPELEVALVPVWARVLELLAKKRRVAAKQLPMNATDPKASWRSALEAYNLRTGPALFEELAKELSLASLKRGAALGRISECLVRWFGAEGST